MKRKISYLLIVSGILLLIYFFSALNGGSNPLIGNTLLSVPTLSGLFGVILVLMGLLEIILTGFVNRRKK